jgi:hypothetical protein
MTKAKFSDTTRKKMTAKIPRKWHPMQAIKVENMEKVMQGTQQVFGNNQFIAILRKIDTEAGGFLLFGIRAIEASANDRTTMETKRRILSECLGPHREVFEVYRNPQNIEAKKYFWFWIMPEGQGMPFNL